MWALRQQPVRREFHAEMPQYENDRSTTELSRFHVGVGVGESAENSASCGIRTVYLRIVKKPNALCHSWQAGDFHAQEQIIIIIIINTARIFPEPVRQEQSRCICQQCQAKLVYLLQLGERSPGRDPLPSGRAESYLSTAMADGHGFFMSFVLIDSSSAWNEADSGPSLTT